MASRRSGTIDELVTPVVGVFVPPAVVVTRPTGATTAKRAATLVVRARRATRGELVVLGGWSIPVIGGCLLVEPGRAPSEQS